MSNSVFVSKNINSFMHNPCVLGGKVALVPPVLAFLLNQGVTYTAVAYGVTGPQLITIALTTGGTAGAEVVTVVGNAISIQIQSGTSSQQNIADAILGSAAAAVLINVSVASGATVVTAPVTATHLAGAVDSVSSVTGVGITSVAQTKVGEYTYTLDDSYGTLLGCSFTVGGSSGADLVPQIKTGDVTTAKTIVVRLLADADPTDVGAATTLYFMALLDGTAVVPAS